MKTKLIILLISFTVLSIKVSASTEINNALKKQCDYLVNLNGKNIEAYNTYLLGVVTGMKYVIPAEEAKQDGKNTKAGENTLNHMTSLNFDLNLTI